MMSNRHLCLTVLLFTLFGGSFCLRSHEQLESALSNAKSKSDLAAVMLEVAEYCRMKKSRQEAGRVESTRERLFYDENHPFGMSFEGCRKSAQHILYVCSTKTLVDIGRWNPYTGYGG
ncbi:uncharacterized protein LOC141852310 [Brevipalpus obovatus]|uniref:uncharacterized protein LOC141852310 n=1 Tax=Brevipalpus obovatus TaxID=246614 RepID=UPI003D9DD5AC